MAKPKAEGKGSFSPEVYPFTECREQHHWKPYDGAIDKKAQIAFRVQICGNCGMKKHSQISLYPGEYGQLIRVYYAQPTGYRIPGGIGVIERGQIRVHNFLAELKSKSA